MNHQYIDDHYIIEKFIDQELDQNELTGFYDHCLQCAECRQSVILARQIDDAIFRSQMEMRKTAIVRRMKPKQKLNYVAAATLLLIIGFASGLLLNLNRNDDQNPGLAENPVEKIEKTEPSDNPSGDDTVPKKPVLKQTPESPTQVKEKKIPANEQASYEKDPDQEVLYAKADIDLDDLNDRLNLNASEVTKGIGSKKTDVKKMMTELGQGQNFNPTLDITKPYKDAVIQAGEVLEVKWTGQESAHFMVAFVNRGTEKVFMAFENIKGMKISYKQGLPAGKYFLVVHEQGTDNWSARSFEVR